MRRFRRWRVVMNGWFRFMALLILFAYAAVRLIEWQLWGPLVALAETEAKARAIHGVNQILYQGFADKLSQADLITYQKDQQGQITAYQVNTQLVNRVAKDAAVAVEGEVSHLADSDFEVPLGGVSGTRILRSWGPHIPLRIVPTGTVTTDIKQSFETAGINQTRHAIWLEAVAQVRVVLPFVSKDVQVTAQLPITETVLIGRVPTYYGSLGSASLPVEPAQ